MILTEKRLETLKDLISKPTFLENKGLGNEVGYYIFDYPPKDEMIVRDWIKGTAKRNVPSLLSIDLYDLVISLLQKEDFLEKCYKFEKDRGLGHLETIIGRLVEINNGDGWLVNAIRSMSKGHSVVLIQGVGKVFPFLRSHAVLNILHQNIDGTPTIMFYPGEYNEQDLCLFDKVNDGNYYRAFRIIE